MAKLQVDASLLFALKKWILVCFSTVQIIALIIYAAFAQVFADVRVENGDAFTEDDEIALRTSTLATILVISIIGIAIQLTGLLGALRESLPLISTYAVLMLLGTICIIAQAFVESSYWCSSALAIAMCLLVVLFWFDLKNRRLPLDYDAA